MSNPAQTNSKTSLLLLSLLWACSLRADPVTFDFSSPGNSQISFDGTSGSVVFSPDSLGHDFQIVDSSLAGLVGLEGTVSSTYLIGPITSFGLLQSAPVSGAGILSISDGSSLFSAKLLWNDVETFGSSGVLNTNGVTNLSNFSYSGSNPALQELANDGSGIATVSFQFIPLLTLSQLASGGTPESTSFSGSAVIAAQAVPDSGDIALLLGLAFLILAAAKHRTKAARI
jgi:hypothetical protein